jgi:hypothetical protein
VAAWPVSVATPVLAAPSRAIAAFGSLGNEAQRGEASRAIVSTLVSAAPKEFADAARRKRVEDFLAAWDKARGEWTRAAFVYEKRGQLGVLLRLGAKDPKALAASMHEALTTTIAIGNVVEGLKKEGISAKFSTEKIGTIDARVLSLTLPRKSKTAPKAGEPTTAEVVWGVDEKTHEVVVAGGVGARALLPLALESSDSGPQSLASIDHVAQTFTSFGSTISGSVLVFPSRIVPALKGGPVVVRVPSDPITLAIGRAGQKNIFIDTTVSKASAGVIAMLVIGAL